MSGKHQINSRNLLMQHYLLGKRPEKAQEIATSLPDCYGIKYDCFRAIAQHEQNHMKAQTDAIQSSCIKCREYAMSLFHRAKCISENELNKQVYIIQAWQDMADASKTFISLYADVLQPKVNAYEDNPFCYLITAYASMCHEYLRFLDLHNALICLEKATAKNFDYFGGWFLYSCNHYSVSSIPMYGLFQQSIDL